MRRLAVAITFLSVICLLPKNSEAQVFGPLVVEGPSLELDLPPLLRVRIGPAPVLRFRGPRARVVQMAPPPPPPPPPQEPPPPPVRVYVVRPEAAPPPPPPPPGRRRYRRRHVDVPPPPPSTIHHRVGISVGGFLDTTMFKDGQMLGAALDMRWRISRHWALTGTLSGLGSCTPCNKDADTSRRDFNWTIGAMYFLFPRYWITPYARAAFVYNHASFRQDGVMVSKVSQGGAEVGLGLEWRVNQWLAFVADANVMALGEMSKSSGEPPVTDGEGDWKGIPGASNDDVAARLRLGVMVKF